MINKLLFQKAALQLLHVISALQQRIATGSTAICSYLRFTLFPSRWPSRGGSQRSRPSSKGFRPSAPRRAAIVIAEPWLSSNLDDLASIVWWCSELNVTELQVYEQLGGLKASASQLEKRLNFRSKGEYCVTVGFETSCALDKGTRAATPSGLESTSTSATDASHDGEINLLSTQDIASVLSQACCIGSTEFTRGNGTKQASSSEYGAFYNAITAVGGLRAVQEPQFVLVFGPVLTLAGFPPWLLRHSEIYHSGRLANVNKHTIAKAVQRFCKTSQRFGV